MSKKEIIIAAICASVLTLLIFGQFFLKGLYPFPGDFMLAWFQPWKNNFSVNNVITISHKPIADDVFRQIYPFKVLANDLFKNYQWPLWNPYSGSGMPLFATMHVGFLNPFNIFFLIFNEKLAWTFFIIVQPILIFFFTYLYYRKIGISFLSSIFSSTIFTLSGFVITRTIYGDYDYALVTLPIFLYIIESYLFENSKKILFIPSVMVFSIFSTQPQIVFYILIFSIIYACIRSTSLKTPLKKLLVLFFYMLIGVGLASIQLIPTLELYRYANIAPSTSEFIFDRFLLPLQHFISLFIPNYFGNQSTYNYWGNGDYIETITYMGLIPLFLTYIAFIFVKKNLLIKLLFGTTVFICILLTLDWPGTRFLYSLPIPITGTSIPTRIFFLLCFSISVLAGLGLDDLYLHKKIDLKLLKRLIPFFSFIFVVGLITTLFYLLQIPCNNQNILHCRSIALRNTILELTILSATCITIIVIRKLIKNKLSIQYIFILFSIFIGLYNSYKFLPFTSAHNIMMSNDLISFLKNNIDGRAMGFGDATIKTNFATYYRFLDPNYYDPLYIKRYGELVRYANTATIENLSRSDVEIANEVSLKNNSTEEKRNRLLNLLSVKYLIYPKVATEGVDTVWQNKFWSIQKNQTALDHIYFATTYEIVNNDTQLLKKLFDSSFDYKKRVLLESKPALDTTNRENDTKTIEINEYTPNTISLTVKTSSNSLLVITDNYYPGWKAYVDNNEVPIYRTNYSFRSIAVPAGNHTIKFTYKPQSLQYGIQASLLFLFIYILLILWPKVSSYKNHR